MLWICNWELGSSVFLQSDFYWYRKWLYFHKHLFFGKSCIIATAASFILCWRYWLTFLYSGSFPHLNCFFCAKLEAKIMQCVSHQTVTVFPFVEWKGVNVPASCNSRWFQTAFLLIHLLANFIEHSDLWNSVAFCCFFPCNLFICPPYFELRFWRDVFQNFLGNPAS